LKGKRISGLELIFITVEEVIGAKLIATKLLLHCILHFD
jgi:hypothetical protein